MAIRSIANREKHKKEEKGRTHKESSDKVSNTTVKELQAAKMGSDAQDTTTFTEVFDSSKYDSMAEMKKSADVQEEEHSKEVLSRDEREEPAEPAITDVQTSNVDMNSSPTTATAADTSQPNLEERAAELRGSKPEQIIDNSSTDREKLQEEIVEAKDKKGEAETRLTHGLADPYSLLSDVAKSWTDLYIESARNVAEITGYWLDLFSKPWSTALKTKNKTNVE
jgi:hypothetical protein